MRGFEKISFEQFSKDFKVHPDIETMYNDLKLPSRATKYSAGYDFYAPFDIVLRPGGTMKIPTGIKSYMNEDEMLMLVNKSGIGFKYNIRLLNQVAIIDYDYYNNSDNEGNIWIAIENEGDMMFRVNKGEKFVQGIFIKYLTIDNDAVSVERTGGMGSTGKE